MHEAEIETTPQGHVPVSGGWFVLNLAEMAWETVPGFGVWRGFDAPDADPAAPGVGVHVHRRWDYLHSPPGTEHITVGAGDEPCVILMFGSPDPSRNIEWIANETAAKHGASVKETTGRSTEAYGELPEPVRVRAPGPFGGLQ
jgi:hypothetical protein